MITITVVFGLIIISLLPVAAVPGVVEHLHQTPSVEHIASLPVLNRVGVQRSVVHLHCCTTPDEQSPSKEKTKRPGFRAQGDQRGHCHQELAGIQGSECNHRLPVSQGQRYFLDKPQIQHE